jgi:hypothetical protein
MSSYHASQLVSQATNRVTTLNIVENSLSETKFQIKEDSTPVISPAPKSCYKEQFLKNVIQSI